MKRISLLLLLAVVVCLSSTAGDKLNKEWQRAVLAAIDEFPEGGGYYTGGRPNQLFPRTTMQALHLSFQMLPGDERPQFNPATATPSFCSSATYAVLLRALLNWDMRHRISQAAWRNLKPYVGIPDELNPTGLFQDDGVGCWGRANANGPGVGVLVHDLDAGYSFTAFRGAVADSVKETPTEPYLTAEQWAAHPIWKRARPGDVMKIFWNRHDTRGHDGGAIIGVDGVRGHLQEAGHSVIFLGINADDEVMYWSSNGPGQYPEMMGYGRSSCSKDAIQRVVFTRITRPERFDNARLIAPTDRSEYLMMLNGHGHSTTAQMLEALGIKSR